MRYAFRRLGNMHPGKEINESMNQPYFINHSINNQGIKT